MILSPWLIYSAYKSYKEKKEQAANQSQDDESQKSSAAIEQPLEQLDFNVYSAFAIHALGENETIIKEIQNFLCTRQISQNPYPIRVLPS